MSSITPSFALSSSRPQQRGEEQHRTLHRTLLRSISSGKPCQAEALQPLRHPRLQVPLLRCAGRKQNVARHDGGVRSGQVGEERLLQPQLPRETQAPRPARGGPRCCQLTPRLPPPPPPQLLHLSSSRPAQQPRCQPEAHVMLTILPSGSYGLAPRRIAHSTAARSLVVADIARRSAACG